MRVILLFCCFLFSLYSLSFAVNAPDKSLRKDHKGFECIVCHEEVVPTDPISIECSACHDIEDLIKETRNMKPYNPHDNPHEDISLSCASCHQEHGKDTNACISCHSTERRRGYDENVRGSGQGYGQGNGNGNKRGRGN